VLAPRGDRVRVVQPARDTHGLPQPLDVWLTEHRVGPAGVRSGDDAPLHPPSQKHLTAATSQSQRLRGDHRRRVQVIQQVWVRVPSQPHMRSTLTLQPIQPEIVHIRTLGQRGRRPMGNAGAAEMIILVHHLEQTSTSLVGRPPPPAQARRAPPAHGSPPADLAARSARHPPRPRLSGGQDRTQTRAWTSSELATSGSQSPPSWRCRDIRSRSEGNS
jgi:hypothetical protein